MRVPEASPVLPPEILTPLVDLRNSGPRAPVEPPKPEIVRKERKNASIYDLKWWRDTAEQVRKRDGYRCTECGRPGRDVHHKTLRTEGGSDEPENLVTLCVDCHAAYHPNVPLAGWRHRA